MTLEPENPPPPIGADDRYTAAKLLKEAYEKGRISDQERDERLRQVLAAATHDDLLQALTSLPGQPPGSTATIAAVGGRIRRRGAWRVPRVLRVESAFGRVKLDLSRAVIEHPVVDIEVRLGTGRATVTVPRDAIVTTDDLTGWRDTHYRPRRRPRPGGPVIRISGTVGLGRLKIRQAWR